MTWFLCVLRSLIYWLGQSQHLSGHQYQHTALIGLESDDLTPLMLNCHAEGQFQDTNLQNILQVAKGFI